MAIILHKLYIDSNIIIAMLSGNELYSEHSKLILLKIASGECSGISAVIVLVEVIKIAKSSVNPNEFIANLPNFSLQNINKNTAMLAQDLRIKFTSLTAADALHLASAIEQNCDYFISQDQKLSKIASKFIKTTTVSEYLNKK